MSEAMKRQVSALMDGELEDHEISPLLRALHTDEGLRAGWDDYQRVGVALRGDGDLLIDITGSVMARLAEEPTVLAPAPRRGTGWQRPLLALAASAAGVTLVGVLALAPAADHEAPAMRAASSVPPKAAQATPRLQEYLVAHQAHAPVAGASRSIRTVAMAREGR